MHIAPDSAQFIILIYTLQLDVKQDRCIANYYAAASANQRRMNADPLEVMLMNMGYRMGRGSGRDNTDSEATDDDGGGGDMQCRPF